MRVMTSTQAGKSPLMLSVSVSLPGSHNLCSIVPQWNPPFDRCLDHNKLYSHRQTMINTKPRDSRGSHRS